MGTKHTSEDVHLSSHGYKPELVIIIYFTLQMVWDAGIRGHAHPWFRLFGMLHRFGFRVFCAASRLTLAGVSSKNQETYPFSRTFVSTSQMFMFFLTSLITYENGVPFFPSFCVSVEVKVVFLQYLAPPTGQKRCRVNICAFLDRNSLCGPHAVWLEGLRHWL